jgi:hypothetical protein
MFLLGILRPQKDQYIRGISLATPDDGVVQT